MRVDARVQAWASLNLLDGVGNRALFELLKAFGGPEEILAASGGSLSAVVGAALSPLIVRGPEPAELERTLAWVSEDGHHLLAWDDAAYPRRLLAIADSPAVFYYAGRLDLLAQPSLAIVGSRNATAQGVDHAEAFAAAFSRAGITVVSGLALGIDAAAHRGGLAAAGSSIAVVATGLDRVYPAVHRDLARELADRGGLLSEFTLGTPPVAGHFPRRNRLISGLSLGVLVVEATLKSGSLITARQAAEQGREVFAIPGSIHSPFSRGCHRLIKDGAKLVETAQDVLDELALSARLDPVSPSAAGGRPDAPEPSGPRTQVLDALGFDPVGLDALALRTHLPASDVSVALVELELAGRIAALPGGVFQRLR